jgi:hypothetical protein
MAEAALKYDEFEDFDDIEPVQIPAGGIATFLTAREGMFADDDDDELPSGGIASVKQVADKLAEYGRHEDEFMVHAAEGETVIPMEVFRKNPILKENIFRQMRDMGLEPERYVVGNELNSINPVTGQPEFFIKKLFKKLGKFLKKAVSVVLPIVGAIFLGPLGASLGSGIATLIQGGNLKDAFKAAALSGLTAGAMNAIGGGIQAVQGGGTFLEGAKAGAFGEGALTRTFAEAGTAGATAAGTRAAELAQVGGASLDPSKLTVADAKNLADIQAAGVSQETFNKAIASGSSIADVANAAPELAKAQQYAALQGMGVDQVKFDQLAGGQVSPTPSQLQQSMITEMKTVGGLTDANLQLAQSRGLSVEDLYGRFNQGGLDAVSTLPPPRPVASEPFTQGPIIDTATGETIVRDPNLQARPGVVDDVSQAGAGAEAATQIAGTADKPLLPSYQTAFDKLIPGYGDKYKFDLFGGAKDLFLPDMSVRAAAIEQATAEGLKSGTTAFSARVAELVGINKPGMLRRFLPAIGAMGIGNLVSGPENPEAVDMSQEGTSQALTLLEENPERYRSFQNLQIRGGGQFSPFEIKPIYNEPLGTTTYQSVADVATGGGMNVNDFPPRVGAIAGPGTETSDDIPAMLSDGEFVMTAEAVRGAGNGNRENGMRNMYQMMNQFEAMA